MMTNSYLSQPLVQVDHGTFNQILDMYNSHIVPTGVCTASLGLSGCVLFKCTY